MKNYSLSLIIFLLTLFCSACDDPEQTTELTIVSARAGTINLSLTSTTPSIPHNQSIVVVFSGALNRSAATDAVHLIQDGIAVETTLTFQESDKAVVIDPTDNLLTNAEYSLSIDPGAIGANGEQFSGTTIKFKTSIGQLSISQWTIDDKQITVSPITDVPLTIDLAIQFSQPVEPATFNSTTVTVSPSTVLVIQFSNENKTVLIKSNNPLQDLRKHSIVINGNARGARGETFTGFALDFYTKLDPAPKLPLLPNDEDDDNDNTNDLLSVVQKQTFKYFWDFAHPTSGMARERNNSGDLVTSGGSGFGIMALIVGMERGFITRAQGIERMDKILDFLETADRFHGAWPHWINGTNGDVIPFSANDNGGDLVETAFLVEGLITFRQYLNSGVPAEQTLIARINTLWQGVEWDWYRRSSQNVLYWHWSPNLDWVMNHQIKGWNECLITYVLAASSTTHTIPKNVYDAGWASNGDIQNGNTYEGITLPLGSAYGGPLFFSHYSFLGLDPMNLSDAYANYSTQNTNHSLINYKYCVRNPKQFVGYSEECWGLTASDNHIGYNAHSPTNDLGVITPTAALSSFPYTPDESMKALKFFYYKLGDRLWGEYGFYDAFNLTEGWTANSYLAIDQGPIIVMIENHRTGLLWDLFMSAPEVQAGLTKLGFTY
jgi:hypothetical protein